GGGVWCRKPGEEEAMTVLERSRALLEGEGYLVGPVVRQGPGRTSHLFGLGDLLAVKAEEAGALLVLPTTRDRLEAVVAKAVSIPELRTWLEAGNRFEVHGWLKAGQSGQDGAEGVTRQAVSLADLAPLGSR